MNRAFEMIYLLMQRKSMTAGELAEHFEVSTRTIYRDIDELSAAGIPVYATKGRGGGIHLLENFILDKSLLSEEEQDEILFALQSLKATNAGDGDHISHRLAGLFQKSCTDWIDIDFSHWGSSNYEKEKFKSLKQAILTKRLVCFSYFNANGETSTRKVEPMKLIFKGGNWYLQAFCLDKNSFRTFKIFRMDDVVVLAEHYKEREELIPELSTYWESGESVQYKLLFTERVSYRVYDEFSKHQIKRNEDGTLLVTTTYEKGGWLTRYLLSYGMDVTVISPEEQREKLRNVASNIMNKYI